MGLLEWTLACGGLLGMCGCGLFLDVGDSLLTICRQLLSMGGRILIIAYHHLYPYQLLELPCGLDPHADYFAVVGGTRQPWVM